MKTDKSKGAKKSKRELKFPLKTINIVLGEVLAILTIWLLASDAPNYLRKIEMLQFFAPTALYLKECMALPGGLLTYASTFLTQTFHYPWLGALVYGVVIAGVSMLAMRSFYLPQAIRPLGWVVGASSLAAFLGLGYAIFSLKAPGFAFTLPLGVACAMSAFWLYRKLPRWWLRAIAIVVITAAGYCLTGFYGLLSAAICCVYEIGRLFAFYGRRWWAILIIVAMGAMSIWLVPQAWFAAIGGDVHLTEIYTCPLPVFLEGESALWRPYVLIFIVLGIFSFLCPFALAIGPTIKRPNPLLGFLASAVALAAILCVLPLRFTDPNFRLTLDLDEALQGGRWHDAIDIARDAADIEPTRVNVMLTDMAMLRAGCLADSAFAFPIASAPYATVRDLRATHDIASRAVAYHLGMVNFAYRWAMEYKVEYGMSIEQLQYMAKTAILNGDFALARKALDNLSLTACHADWAKRYYPYLDNPELIARDPEMQSIRRIATDYDGFIMDHGRLEGYLWNFLKAHHNGSAEAMELSMTAALISQDLQAFAQLLPQYAASAKELPVHIQEGILVMTSVYEDFDLTPYKIDPRVMGRFKSFLQISSEHSKFGEAHQREVLKGIFGDTFWYYYLFCEGLTIV